LFDQESIECEILLPIMHAKEPLIHSGRSELQAKVSRIKSHIAHENRMRGLATQKLAFLDARYEFMNTPEGSPGGHWWVLGEVEGEVKESDLRRRLRAIAPLLRRLATQKLAFLDARYEFMNTPEAP
ncbi:MAG: hypothetical protein MUP44_13690, partial [Anaerolineales bacterium]|nr:hypothetical protein [Anaerolineales bacterium]